MMKNVWDRWVQDENGAVTVDWVVLTAAIVLFAVSTLLLLADGTKNIGNTTSNELGKISARVPTGTVTN